MSNRGRRKSEKNISEASGIRTGYYACSVEWHSADDATGDRKSNQYQEKSCTDNDPVIVDQTGIQKICRSDQAGKNESIYAVDFTDRLSGT